MQLTSNTSKTTAMQIENILESREQLRSTCIVALREIEKDIPIRFYFIFCIFVIKI